MNDYIVPTGPSGPALEARPLPVWTWAVLVALAALVFAVGYDQGQLLRPLLGRASYAGNYLHELFHDGRHLLGFPCH